MHVFRSLALATTLILATSTTSFSAGRDILTTVAKAGNFNTFLAAVTKAGLLKTLKGKGPFTVFVPTDEAFAKLGATLPELLLPENKEKLTAILTYHIVNGKLLGDDLKSGFEPATFHGGTVKFAESGKVINGVNIIDSDIIAINGVVHVIDKVLVPPPAKK